jgi:hypothetical protein
MIRKCTQWWKNMTKKNKKYKKMTVSFRHTRKYKKNG